MNLTSKGFKKPIETEAFNLGIFNDNADLADSLIVDLENNKLDKTGDGKAVTVTFSSATVDANIASGETLATLFGKILKRFSILATSISNIVNGTTTVSKATTSASCTGNAATATTAEKAGNITGVAAIINGGTGATTAEEARTNLAIPPKSHASNDNTYGLGSVNNYGHIKIVDDLGQSQYAEGVALSSRQGYILNQNKIDKVTPFNYSGTTAINGKTQICSIDITKHKHLSINTGYKALYDLVIISSSLYLIGLYERSESDRANKFEKFLISDTEVTIVDTNFDTPYYSVKRSGNLLIVYHVNNYSSAQNYDICIY